MTRTCALGILLLAASGCEDGPGQVRIDFEADAGIDAPDAFFPSKDGAAPPADAGPPPADAGPAADAAPVPVTVVSVETALGAGITVAGVANQVTCTALDADGEPVDDVNLRFEIRPGEGWRPVEMEPGQVIGETAGTFLVACHAPNLGLRDGTPARWDVMPAEADRVVAFVEPDVIVAGDTAQVRCGAWDAFGNPIDTADANVQVRPEALGVEVIDREVRITTADAYIVECSLPGAASIVGADLDVVPATPDRLVATVAPVRPVYDVGQVVGYAAQVVDAFGNAIPDAPLIWSSRPPVPAFGEGRYRPLAEGRYTLRVEVEGTDLADEAEILVDAGGPAIACLNPPDGAMVGQGRLNLEGRVADVAGVDSLTVDGEPVPVAEDGRFSVAVNPSWGLNVRELVARDAVGNVNSAFCVWFSANEYAREAARVGDTIQMHLSQAAIDDGAPDNPIRSITDLLRRVLNSPELIATLDETLRGQNPIVPNDCRQRVPIFGGCAIRAGATYEGMRIRGSRTASVALVNGGMRLRVRINALEIDARLTGTFTNRGTISAEYIEVDLTFDTRLRNNRPEVSLRGAGMARIGDLDSDFDGVVTGFIIELVFEGFEETIRNELVDALEGFIADETDDLLAGVLNGLDLNALAVQLNLPGFGGQPATPLSLAVDFSSINVNPQRMLLGISTRVDGPTRQAARSAGVPMPPGARTTVMRPRGNSAAAVNLGLINQLLHRAWRAGYFAIPDAGALLGGLPEGARFGLQVLIPPAVRGRGGATGIELHLGPAIAEVAYPGLFDEPITLRMVAFAEAGVALDGGTDLSFEDLEVTRLHLAVDDVNLSPQARATLERELGRIVQSLLDTSLAGALPSLPVPDFALPAALQAFGIPRNTRLGLRDLSLTNNPTHFILDGNLRQ